MVPTKGFGLFEDIDGGAEVGEEFVDEVGIDLGIEGVDRDLAEIVEDRPAGWFLAS